MYKLRIYINPDNDFSYKYFLFEDAYVNTEIFFEERIDAVKLLYDVVTKMANSISTSKEHAQTMVDTIRLLPKYIELIIKKIPVFKVRISSRNQSVEFELARVTKKPFGKGYLYEKDDRMSFDFFVFNPEEYKYYNWNILYEMPDIE